MTPRSCSSTREPPDPAARDRARDVAAPPRQGPGRPGRMSSAKRPVDDEALALASADVLTRASDDRDGTFGRQRQRRDRCASGAVRSQPCLGLKPTRSGHATMGECDRRTTMAQRLKISRSRAPATGRSRSSNIEPSWPAFYIAERERLVALLPGLQIHHIGSTAVPGLAAKSVIDMIALVDDLEANIAAVIEPGQLRTARTVQREPGAPALPLLSDNLLSHASSAPRRRARGPRSVPALSGRSPKRPQARRRIRRAEASARRALPRGPRGIHEGQDRVYPATPTHEPGLPAVRFAMSGRQRGRARPRCRQAGDVGARSVPPERKARTEVLGGLALSARIERDTPYMSVSLSVGSSGESRPQS